MDLKNYNMLWIQRLYNKGIFSNYFSGINLILHVIFLKNEITYHKKRSEPWKITLVDTGERKQ